MYFLYNLDPLFHLKVPEIPFSNSQLFPHANDLLLQETPFELVERRSSAGIGRHVELHPPVRGAVAATYHVVVLVGVEGLGHALCC